MDYKELHLIGSSSPHIRTKDGTSHIMAEVLIALVEAAAYTRLLPAHGPRRAFAYGLTANICSAALGFFLAEPVWRWVVSIS